MLKPDPFNLVLPRKQTFQNIKIDRKNNNRIFNVEQRFLQRKAAVFGPGFLSSMVLTTPPHNMS